MTGGSNSIYGFVYQIYLSLLVAESGSLDLLKPARLLSDQEVDHNSADGQNPAALPQTDPSHFSPLVRLETTFSLEARSDIDIHFPSGEVQYIQAKSHPMTRRGWTITTLFKDVLQKFPAETGTSNAAIDYVLVTDTPLSPDAEQLMAFCDLLRTAPRDLRLVGDDAAWKNWLAAHENPQLMICLRKSAIWGKGTTSPCLIVTDLPAFVASTGALVRGPTSKGILEPSMTEGGGQSWKCTLSEVCRVLAGFHVIPNILQQELQRSLRNRIRRYVPETAFHSQIDAVIRQMVKVALDIATAPTKIRRTREELLRMVGITGEPYERNRILGACQGIAAHSISRLSIAGDIPIPARRRDTDEAFCAFLSDKQKSIFLITGDAKSGKTRQLITWARDHNDLGPVYIDNAKGYHLRNPGTVICTELGHESSTSLTLLSIIHRYSQCSQATQDPSWLLFVDALDEVTSADELPMCLDELLMKLGSLPVKLVLSCKSSEWHRCADPWLPYRAAFFRPLCAGDEQQTAESGAGLILPSVELGRLTQNELDMVLTDNKMAINDFGQLEMPQLQSSNPRRTHSAPSAPFREYLSSPLILGAFYRLDPVRRQDALHRQVTSVEIYASLCDQLLDEWSKRSRRNRESLVLVMLELAETIRDLHVASGCVPIKNLRKRKFSAPMEWDVMREESLPWCAVQVGLLQTFNDDDGRGTCFGFAPPYFLEYALMLGLVRGCDDMLAGSDPGLQDWTSELLQEAQDHGFDPLFVALAWLVQHYSLKEGAATAQRLLRSVFSARGGLSTDFVSHMSFPAIAPLKNLTIGGTMGAAAALLELSVDELLDCLEQLSESGDSACELLHSLASTDGPFLSMAQFRRVILHRTDDWRGKRAVSNALTAVALRHLDDGRCDALREIESYLIGSDEDLRLRCAYILNWIGHSSSLEAYCRALPLSAQSPEVFGVLALASAGLGTGNAPLLLRALDAFHPRDERSETGRSLVIKALGVLQTDWSVSILKRLLTRPAEESPHSLQSLLDACLTAGATDSVLDFLESSWDDSFLLGPDTAVWKAASAHCARGIHILVDGLEKVVWRNEQLLFRENGSQGAETRRPSMLKLWQLFRALGGVRSLEEADALLSYGLGYHPISHVESAAYRLLVEIPSPGGRGETIDGGVRKGALRVLGQIASPAFGQALAAVAASGMPDQCLSLEAVRTLQCVVSPEQLPALSRIELEARPLLDHQGSDHMPDEDPVTSRSQLIAREAAVAIGCIGTGEAFETLLLMLRHHNPEVLYGVLEGIRLLPPDVIVAEELQAIGCDRSAPTANRIHALIAWAERDDNLDATRLLDLFREQQEPYFAGYLAKLLAFVSAVDAIPFIREALASATQAQRAVYKEALCRLGCDLTTQNVLAGDQWADTERDRATWLAQYPCEGPLCRSVDAQLAHWLASESYDVRSSACLAIRERYAQQELPQPLVVALQRSLQRPRSAESSGTDDHIVPGMLGRVNPESLCAIALDLELTAWSPHSKTTLAQALGATGSQAAVASVVRLLEDADPWVRRSAGRALSEIGHDTSQQVLEGFAANLWPRPSIAAEALIWAPWHWADELMSHLLDHADGRVRRRAREAVQGREARAEAEKLLGKIAETCSPLVRWAYAETLCSVGDEITIGSLQSLGERFDNSHDSRGLILLEHCIDRISKRLKQLEQDRRRTSNY